MKKNNMLRIASVLLVAVLLSTCAISGAFAKYTTSATASDEARVAKFNTSATLADLGAFSETEGTDGAYTVSNTTSDKKGLVAPGTKGKAGSFAFTGTSEVAVEISYTGTVTLTGWEYTIPVEGEEPDKVVEYCPIIFTVNKKDLTIDTANNETVTEFAARVSAEIAKTEKVTVYAGATVPADATQPSVSWRWAFDKAQGPAFQDDTLDTKLGALGTAGVKITLTATIDQKD